MTTGWAAGRRACPGPWWKASRWSWTRVSGATVSSKCILKAVETALRQGG